MSQTPLLTTRRKFLNFTTALILSTALTTATISPVTALSGPEQHVTAIASSVIRLANSGRRGVTLHKKFEQLLASHANMNAVATFALGRYRRKLPKSLKAKYNKLVKAYIAGLFVYYADDFKGRSLEINGTAKSGKSLIINSRIKFSGSSKKVKWRVYSKGSRHRVTDVNIRGIWLSIQLRQKVTQILKRNKGDFEPLITFLGEYRNWMPKG